jgi:UDP-glucuronate 4-epimerase
MASMIESKAKRVLVTGVAGFIGSHVADFLMSRGDSVIGIDEINDYYDVSLKMSNIAMLREKYGDQFHMFRGDICAIDVITEIFESERPTHICHLAARAGVRPSIEDPYIYIHSNVEGTTRLLDLARQYKVVNFVYASSSSVYGCSQSEVLSEKDVVDTPVSPYAASKKATELIAYTFHHLYGLNTTGLRFFTVYGPRGRPDMAPFKFIDRISRGTAIQQFGDGSTSRDYTYITDIVDGVVRAIDRPLGYQVFNLGNGRPFKLSDFIALVQKNVGRKALIEVLPEQPGDVQRTCADIDKARELLGYSPKVTFEEGIRQTAEWYRSAVAAGIFTKKGEDAVNSINYDTYTSAYVPKASSYIRADGTFIEDPNQFNSAYTAYYERKFGISALQVMGLKSKAAAAAAASQENLQRMAQQQALKKLSNSNLQGLGLGLASPMSSSPPDLGSLQMADQANKMQRKMPSSSNLADMVR